MNENEKQIFEFRLDILKQEIDQLQQNIRNYNNSLIIIKGWSITIFSGLIAFAIKEQNSNILLVGIITAIMFWMFDAFIRRIQQFFISRYNKIEWFLRNPRLLKEAWEKLTFPKLNFPDMSGNKSVKDIDFKTSYFRVAMRTNVSMLYLIQIFVLTLTWIMVYFEFL